MAGRQSQGLILLLGLTNEPARHIPLERVDFEKGEKKVGAKTGWLGPEKEKKGERENEVKWEENTYFQNDSGTIITLSGFKIFGSNEGQSFFLYKKVLRVQLRKAKS